MVICDRLEVDTGESCGLKSWPRPTGPHGKLPKQVPGGVLPSGGSLGQEQLELGRGSGAGGPGQSMEKGPGGAGSDGCHTLAMLQIGCRGPGWAQGASVQAETRAAGPGRCWGWGRRWLDRACAFEGPCQCTRCVGRREEGLGQLRGSGLGSRRDGAMHQELGGGRRWAWGGGAWVWADLSPGWVL